MSAPFLPALDTFAGGQMTDLPVYAGGLDLTALLEIVSPGLAATGVNYSITLKLLAALINQAIVSQPTIVTALHAAGFGQGLQWDRVSLQSHHHQHERL
jgi:hypothetical protein